MYLCKKVFRIKNSKSFNSTWKSMRNALLKGTKNKRKSFGERNYRNSKLYFIWWGWRNGSNIWWFTELDRYLAKNMFQYRLISIIERWDSEDFIPLVFAAYVFFWFYMFEHKQHNKHTLIIISTNNLNQVLGGTVSDSFRFWLCCSSTGLLF